MRGVPDRWSLLPTPLAFHGSLTQRARLGESDHDGLGEPVPLATVGTGSTGAIEILVCCDTTRRNEVVLIGGHLGDGGNLRARMAEIGDAAGGHRHVVFVLKFDVS
jgi:hypothetical protein